MASRSLTFIAPLLALTFTIGSAVAQQATVPECKHLDYRGNFRLNGAKNHLDLASRSTTAPDVKQSRIADATRLLTDAARAGGVDQASLWYMFGELYSLTRDLAGADSAFTKVEAVTDPECKRLIERERRAIWVPLQNQGVELMNGGNVDSALTLFRTSNRIYRSEPYSYLNMASIFYNKSQLPLDSASVAEEAGRRGVADSMVRRERRTATDSAVVYFRLAARSSQDRRFDDARETALFNAARLVQASASDTASVHAAAVRAGTPDSVVRAARLRDAEAAYREVLAIRPRDLPAQASLAGVLTALHHEDEARTVYDSMLAHADSMDAFDLMDAGTALFRSHRFALAARAMELGVAKNPCFRDGLYNLANVYLAGADTVKLLGMARRLVAQDSMNPASLQVLARAWQDNGNKDSTLHVLQRAEALPWELSVVRFTPGDTTASLHAMVTNRRSAPQKGFTLTIQFVNAACEVVQSQPVDLPDLNPNGNPGQSYDFTVSGTGRGIIAWKYKPN